jgi:hypothetical protein
MRLITPANTYKEAASRYTFDYTDPTWIVKKVHYQPFLQTACPIRGPGMYTVNV